MSQALNNLKKLIIEVVEEEVSTNEYANTQAKKRKKRGLEEKLNFYIENPKEASSIIENAHKHVSQFKDQQTEDLLSLMVINKYFKKTNY